MKKIILSIIFCGLWIECFSQLKSQTSEIFELSSIVFRLAGAEEFMNNAIPEYTKDIDLYFAPYASHDLITYIKEIREKNGIAYDAVMNAAACMTIEHGQVKVKPNFNVFDIVKVDPRWTTDTYTKYVNRLNDFYKTSRFNSFYNSHKRLYKVATQRLDKVLSMVNVKWFESFFGKKLDEPLVIASLSNGGANYGLGVLSDCIKPGIVIGCRADRKGLPQYSLNSALLLVVHELSHCFSNKLLLDAWDEKFEPAVMKIYSNVEERMSKRGYGDPGIMLMEWFNNLCELMYYRENPSKYINVNGQTGLYQYRGFIWMERSVDFMDEFYENRETYVTIKEYIPRLLAFIDETAAGFDKIIEEDILKIPRIIETSPVSGAILNSDRLVMRFSVPMCTKAYGYKKVQDSDALAVPIKREYWQDSTTFVIEINTKKLQKNKKYGIQLSRQFYQSEITYPLAENYNFYFYTPE